MHTFERKVKMNTELSSSLLALKRSRTTTNQKYHFEQLLLDLLASIQIAQTKRFQSVPCCKMAFSHTLFMLSHVWHMRKQQVRCVCHLLHFLIGLPPTRDAKNKCKSVERVSNRLQFMRCAVFSFSFLVVFLFLFVVVHCRALYCMIFYQRFVVAVAAVCCLRCWV